MPGVLVIAVLTFIVYLILGYNFSNSITTFVTVLVVSCPCSLGLATPLAIVVAEGLCAGKGILVKKSEILENAGKIDTAVFDKTGTLTYGTLKISEIRNYSELENEKLLSIVGSLENKSTHPIASAFNNYLEEKKLEKFYVQEFENISGAGIIGIVENKKILVGSSKILEKYNIENNYKDDEKQIAQNGNSIVYVVFDGKIKALIGVNDVLRKEAKSVIARLNEKKIQTIMLTGDNKETAEKIAKDVGINKVISDVVPAEKSNIIKSLKKENRYILMCGDGINDSPALIEADIGVCVNSGTDIAIDSASVILTQNSLEGIVELKSISKKTIRIIKQNLFWAFFYNMLMIPIATGIFAKYGVVINPMLASMAMVISSLTVILNTLRIKQGDGNFGARKN